MRYRTDVYSALEMIKRLVTALKGTRVGRQERIFMRDIPIQHINVESTSQKHWITTLRMLRQHRKIDSTKRKDKKRLMSVESMSYKRCNSLV